MKRALTLLLILSGCAASRSEGDSARLERGKYLVENVMSCFLCHSEIDWTQDELPAKAKGAGARFPEESIPFKLYAPNITPDPETGIGRWTDEELGRAIREGRSRDGRVLFPTMPYGNYRVISDEDLAAVIAYLRSMPPVKNTVPKNLTPPMPPPPPRAAASSRGEYLASLSDCSGCHTPLDRTMAPNRKLSFAGGFVMTGPWGKVASANITPDPSGLSHYDEELFVRMMRTGQFGGRKLSVLMPTAHLRRMTDEDLKALWAWMSALPPVKHRVDNVDPPSPCKLCGSSHGLGKDN